MRRDFFVDRSDWLNLKLVTAMTKLTDSHELAEVAW